MIVTIVITIIILLYPYLFSVWPGKKRMYTGDPLVQPSPPGPVMSPYAQLNVEKNQVPPPANDDHSVHSDKTP